MATLISIQRLVLGASVLVGSWAIAVPAFAAAMTNASITGNDYYIYTVNSNNQTVLTNNASLNSVLGDKGAKNGNVELFASSETASYDTLAEFKNAPGTTLSGTIGNKNIALSSLNGEDWFGAGAAYNTAYGATNFANTWFNSVLTQFAPSLFTPNPLATANTLQSVRTSIFNAFQNQGGFQRFSDPNIDYVTQDNDGKVNIGLAGHFNAADFLTSAIQKSSLSNIWKNNLTLGLAGKTIQMSEVIKVAYDNGPAQYLYSFNASNSGVVAADDGRSHTGTYEVSFQGEKEVSTPNQSVPEPSLLLGLMGAGGLALRRRKQNQTA